MQCIRCGNTTTRQDGQTSLGGQRWRCDACRRRFTIRSTSAFAHHAFPDDLMMLAVRWYSSYRLSYADIVQRLATRGFTVERSTVYRWVQRLMTIDAPVVRSDAGNNWHMEEQQCQLHGHSVSMYRALDQDGQVVDMFCSERPDATAAHAFFEQTLGTSDYMPKRSGSKKDKRGGKRSRQGIAIEHAHILASKPQAPQESEDSQRDMITDVATAYLDQAKILEQRTQAALQKARSVLVLAGYGAGLRVERDALIVKEGHTHNPQTPMTHALYRAMHNVDRIVCIDCKGGVSFDALRWCASQGITISLLDRHGHLVSELTPEADADVQLRRAQYRCAAQQAIAITKELVQAKLQGQAATLTAHPELPNAAAGRIALDRHIEELERIPDGRMTIDTIRLIEGRAAAAYFAAWQNAPLHWKAGDRRKVPPHWLRVRERASTLSSGRNRHAVDPVNAMLNYAYGVMEGQCRTVLTSLGFDIACGILHADKRSRDSLVYDLMEPLRPVVDGLVLDLLQKTTFAYGDFMRGNDGACRLHPQLARYIVAAGRVNDQAMRDEARRLRDRLLDNIQMELLPA